MKTIIRHISELLSKRMADIAAFVIEQDTPVHLTKNEYNHRVIMSSSHYEKILIQISMYENLLCSEAEIRQVKSIRLEDAMVDMTSSDRNEWRSIPQRFRGKLQKAGGI